MEDTTNYNSLTRAYPIFSAYWPALNFNCAYVNSFLKIHCTVNTLIFSGVWSVKCESFWGPGGVYSATPYPHAGKGATPAPGRPPTNHPHSYRSATDIGPEYIPSKRAYFCGSKVDWITQFSKEVPFNENQILFQCNTCDTFNGELKWAIVHSQIVLKVSW